MVLGILTDDETLGHIGHFGIDRGGILLCEGGSATAFS